MATHFSILAWENPWTKKPGRLQFTGLQRLRHDSVTKHCICDFWASLVTQMVKNLLALWEIWVQSLGQENPLEMGMATHSNILAWRIPWTLGQENPLEKGKATYSSMLTWRIPGTEEPGRLHSMELQESDTTVLLPSF